MKIKENSAIHYIGCDDTDLDLFENRTLCQKAWLIIHI
jgi:hypothetical protein